MGNLALLILRITTGTLMIGHGSQKLFGWFNGPGLEGFGGFMETLGLRPGSRWGIVGGSSEFGGGILTVLGWLNPLGPVGIIASMAMATTKVHSGQPIWNQEGGAELPLTNIAIASTLMLSGPGKYSLDGALGTRLPRWMGAVGLLIALLTVAYAQQDEEESSEEPEAGAE